MSVSIEMMMQQQEVDKKIKNLSQDVNFLRKQVSELCEIILSESEGVRNFIDYEAIEVDSTDIEDQSEEDLEVLFVGTTLPSNKTRRTE